MNYFKQGHKTGRIAVVLQIKIFKLTGEVIYSFNNFIGSGIVIYKTRKNLYLKCWYNECDIIECAFLKLIEK